MAEIKLRPFDPWLDPVAMKAIDREARAHDSKANYSTYNQEDSHNLNIVDRAGQAVGYSMCLPILPRSDKQLLLVRLLVRPQYQRLGLGSLLLSEVIKRATAIGYKTIEAVVFQDQKVARAFLKGTGFKIIGKLPSDLGDNVCFYRLSLRSISRIWAQTLAEKCESRVELPEKNDASR